MKLLLRIITIQTIVACVPLVAESRTQNNNQSNTQESGAESIQRSVSWDERSTAAIALLERSPILKPKPANALSEGEFIALTRIVLGSVNLQALELLGTTVDPRNIRTVDDAVEGLEALIRITIPLHTATSTTTRRKPEASITSNPKNLMVRYRRTVDHRRNKGTFLNVRTDMTRELEPAVYTFICTRENGVEEEQIINCTKDCEVRFR